MRFFGRALGGHDLPLTRMLPAARVRGQVDCGLGKSMAAGAVALLRPTDLIMETGDKRTIDGVEFEFQMAPNSEAPAENAFLHPALQGSEPCGKLHA